MTVSDASAEACGTPADAVKDTLRSFGHVVVREDKVGCDPHEVQRVLREAIEDREVDAIILVGGTGLSKREITLEAVEPFQEKALLGFGEMLSRVSSEESGTPSMRVRAGAFVSEGKVVFCLPGSERLAGLATSRLIGPELSQVLSEARG